MRALLDTSVFLWTVGASGRLSATARDLLEDAESELYFSAASAWEIAVKRARGRLEIMESPAPFVTERIEALALRPLAISVGHAIRSGALPPLHRDPFDRMLIAQAQAEGLALVTPDRNIARYDVETVW